MKTIVSVQEIAELEIKPPAEVAEWRKLMDQEISSRWKNKPGFVRAVCPCCGTAATAPAFSRSGFDYAECAQCGTLFALERPDEASLTAWYRDSAPARFWRDRLLPASAATRLEKIVAPRAQWVLDGIAEYVPNARRLVDVSSSGVPLLAELIAQDTPVSELIAAGVTADLEGNQTRRVSVKPSSLRDLVSFPTADVVVAFDALDRAADMRALVDASHALLTSEGILLATLPVSSGFEVQSLWDKSPTVLPPDKLNIPSIDGLIQLFSAPRWELLELSTPGVFDVEIVRRAILQQPDAAWPRVVRALVVDADESARQAFTEYLQSQRRTSFARLIARRRS
jgi:hypothetical protein